MISRTTLDSILPTVNGRKGELFLKKNCFTPQNALELYQNLKLSLLDVNNWNKSKSVQSNLIDRSGRHVGRIAQIGDRIKIINTGWHSMIQVCDWFQIEKIEERLSGNAEFFYITILPIPNPKTDYPVTLKFPKESTVSIVIIRDEHQIEIQVHTRRKRISFVGSTLRIRMENAVNAILKKRGFNIRQWGKLLKSLLDEGSSNFSNLN